MVSMRAALLQKSKISLRLLRQPEINAVGIGYADPQRPDRGGAIIVYTHKNVVTADVNRMVSRMMEARMPIRYIESGPFRPRPATAVRKRKLKGKMARQKKRAVPSQTIYQRRYRPTPGGVSIGRLVSANASSLGTGGLITIRNNEYFMLSNNHVVIRANQFSVDIYQPGPFEAGLPFAPGDFIGRPALFVPLRVGQANFMDAAIVRGIPNDNIFNPRYIRPFGSNFARFIGLPGHLNAVRVGESVYKSGRTTGLTTGTVEAINADSNVGPYGEIGNATILFRNQAVIAGQTAGGDSGAVWLRQGDNFAVALNFASGGGRSISTPIATVMSTFGMLVAAPSSNGQLRPGTIKNNRVKGDYSYSLPLSTEHRKRILVRRPKEKNNSNRSPI